jgi:hypothetical protein
MNTNALEKTGESSQLPVQSESSSVLHMIERVARDPSVNMDKMMQLMTWRKEIIADQRRAEFDEAMAAAKAEIPTITKNREVDFTSQKGRTHYRYEDLGEIAKVVSPILAKHGLSYRYRTTSNINEPVTVTCIVSHRGGHFEENTLCGGKDDTGGKNLLQQVGSTLTYLQRMTLKAALGLAASNDDDGKASAAPVEPDTPPPGSITQKQADDLRDALEAKGASAKAFLQWAGQKLGSAAKRIDDIKAEHFDACVEAIAGFRKAAQ